MRPQACDRRVESKQLSWLVAGCWLDDKRLGAGKLEPTTVLRCVYVCLCVLRCCVALDGGLITKLDRYRLPSAMEADCFCRRLLDESKSAVVEG